MWCCRDLDTSIFRKDDIVTVRQPEIVERERCPINAYAGGYVAGTSYNSDHPADNPEAIGSDGAVRHPASIIIESTSGKQGQRQRCDHAILRLLLYTALGVDLQVCGLVGIDARKGTLDRF